jgi:hypothetical protein
MIVRPALFTISIILFSLSLLSQKNLERVEIVYKDGKTTKGLIEFKNEQKNLDFLKFYKSKNAEMTKIYPIEVKRFKVANHQYFSALVDIEISPFRKKNLDNNKTPKMEKQQVFLMKVIEGPKSLYFFKAKNGKEHFFILEEGRINTLVHKDYAEYFGTVIRVKENRFYVGQLINYLATEGWNPDFTSYTYTYGKMKELFLFYYRFNEIEPDYIDIIETKRKRKKT